MSTINIHNYEHFKVGDIIQIWAAGVSIPNIMQILEHDDTEMKCLIVQHTTPGIKPGRIKVYMRKEIEEVIFEPKVPNPIIVVNRSVNEYSKEYVDTTVNNRLKFLE